MLSLKVSEKYEFIVLLGNKCAQITILALHTKITKINSFLVSTKLHSIYTIHDHYNCIRASENKISFTSVNIQKALQEQKRITAKYHCIERGNREKTYPYKKRVVVVHRHRELFVQCLFTRIISTCGSLLSYTLF